MSLLNKSDYSLANLGYSQINQIVGSAADSMQMTLDSIASRKKKTVKQRKSAPWYNPQTLSLKQTTHKLERNWCSTRSEESRLAWQDSLKSYRKALPNARAAY